MCLIADPVNFATQLDTSIQDRKVRDLFLPLKEKILAVQREQFETERKHAAEMDELKATTFQLKSSHSIEVANLQNSIAEL